MTWWGGRIRQFRRHVAGRVTADERAALAEQLTSAQLELFDAMHPADQRHGLDVAAAVRAAGEPNVDLFHAALFHDAGKGRSVGLWPRVAWALGEHYGTWVWSLASVLPGFRAALVRIRHHADASAELALRAGCSARAADLILQRAAPGDATLLRALQLADDAN